MDVMTLTEIQVIDLFFRFATVGFLGLLIVFLVYKHERFPAAKVALTICIIGYILLTGPIENNHYGGLRHVLLLLTDLTPFVSLWFICDQLNNNFKLSEVSKWILTPLMLWILGLVYFFLVLGGRGILHDLNHGLGIVVLLTVIYLCLSEYFDDLDNQRRNTRLLLVAFCSFYMTGLVSIEFVYQSIRDTWQFSLFNAIIVFALGGFIAKNIMFNTKSMGIKNKLTSDKIKLEAFDQVQLSALTDLMNKEAFLQSELSIGKLAEQLTVPTHHLRQLINQQLGFSNFSQYLNSYRIPWVCEQLKDTSKKHLPILTLALEAGFGSIAPFNRAFKAQMGQTPKQYRDQF